MTHRGVHLRFNRQVTEIEAHETGRRIALDDGSTLESDLVLFAVGRHPNTAGLGLEAAGVELDADGAICVDEYSRTTLDNIYSVGDCTNRMPLTPVAIAEAMAMVETAFGANPTAMDYHGVPTAVFSQPPLATVGLSESEARERLGEVDVYRSSFRPMKGTLSGRTEKTDPRQRLP